MRFQKYSLDFKTNVFVFRGTCIFYTLFCFKFRMGQGCFGIYKKNKKNKKITTRINHVPVCGGCLCHLCGA
jgi:hypothetical protein